MCRHSRWRSGRSGRSLRSTGCWQVWHRPFQHLKIGCSSRTTWGRVNRSTGLRWAKALEGEEPVGGGDQRGVVVPPQPGPAFVVVQAKFALELLVVQLDLPAQPG